MKKSLICSVVVLGMSSGTLSAEEPFRPFYVGASIGKSTVDTGISAGTSNLEEEDTAYKIFGGTQLNKFIGAEIHYADLGKATLSGNNGDTFSVDGTNYVFNQTGKINFAAKSFGAAATAGYKFGAVRPFAKLGFHRWSLDADYNSATASASASNTGFDTLYGIGAELTILKGLNVRAELERYKVNNFDVDFMSAGINIRF